jgi:hypothetical protein
MYCNYQQDNWADLLPLAEFAYNNAPSKSTGVSPYFANKGYNPTTVTVHPKKEVTSICALEFVADLDSLHQELCSQLASAQQCYQAPVDRKQLPAPKFKVGQQAYL